ncbi:MAG TPA: contact-dependent growth inhibition system immunity protein [Pseudacidobacterium sp.]|jgi:hypothetical protein|nr:contact-dependent growth inhibition system immunity protein [Pseudacidobacterium sp.]
MGGLYTDNYPYLDNLLGCYFHQDFDIEGDTIEEIIAAYRRDHPISLDGLGVRADIHRLLRRYDDSELAQEFVRIFQPDIIAEGWEGMTTRQFLLRMDALLQQP